MTGKERMYASLDKQPVDRVPIFMWFHPETQKRLSLRLEIQPALLGRIMKNDVVMTWVNNNYAMEGIIHNKDGEGHTDAWGIAWEKRGAFNQIVRCPLESSSFEEMKEYRFPDPESEGLLDLMEPVSAEADGYFTGCDVSPCVFEMYNRLRGMKNGLLDLAASPIEAECMLSRCADFAAQLAESAIARYSLDMLWTGDDVSSQQSLLMSPQAWRLIIKPHLKRVIETGKTAGLRTAYHCCGAMREIIPDLIEIGVDILNPIQTSCPGMDPVRLKAEYGHHLAFMGGVDTQYLLPKGSPEEVRRETEQLIDGMTADGGGYILAASHTIPPEASEENIFALYEAAGISKEEIFDSAAAFR